MEKTTDEIPRCISRSEANYNKNNVPMVLMNCYEAILQNDGREIFFLDNFQIK